MSISRTAGAVIAGVAVSGLLVSVPAMNSVAANQTANQTKAAAKGATDCPEALPTEEAVDGLAGTGYTVEKGTKPDPFTAKVLGRITDGIGPGIDMIMAELDSPALTRAGGVWSGMSGSPVYTEDGELIGSVSYTLIGGNTKIAGLTPASDMLALRNDPASARGRSAGTEANEKIAVPQAAVNRIARTGEATAAQARKGFRQASAPVTVIGAAKKKNTKFLQKIQEASGSPVRTTGSGAASTKKSSPDEIFAGSNYAAALAYGDISISGLGTTTFVCDDTAVAWGHPFFSNGPASYTVHPAEALFVQPDPSWSAFKVGNPGGPVGTVTWDGTVGLRSTLGELPEDQFTVKTELTNDHGKKIKGQTVGVYQPWASDIAALHLQAAIVKALGAQSAGSSKVKIVVHGATEDGEKFQVSREDYFADTYDISYTTADSLYFLLLELTGQSFEPISITGVEVKGSVSTKVNQFRVSKLETKQKNKWVALKDVTDAAAGASVPVRATLKGYKNSDSLTVNLTVPVPDEASGATGSLNIYDGRTGSYLGEEEEAESPDSLEELIEELNDAPASNQLISELSLSTGEDEEVLTTKRVAEVQGVVDWFSKTVSVSVK